MVFVNRPLTIRRVNWPARMIEKFSDCFQKMLVLFTLNESEGKRRTLFGHYFHIFKSEALTYCCLSCSSVRVTMPATTSRLHLTSTGTNSSLVPLKRTVGPIQLML